MAAVWGRRASPGLGRALLLPPAAFALHQLRYTLAYGGGTGAELRRTGHSYLHSVVPWLVLAVAIAVGCFLRAVGRAFAGRTSPRGFTMSFAAVWALCAAGLVAIFACQESLEGLFATGHPAGWAAVFGDGGWWAVPVAVCLGLVLAALFHGARWVVRTVAERRRARSVAWPAPAATVFALRDEAIVACSPWLGGRSSRGPPA